MQKPGKHQWQIVPHPIQTKVARLWWSRENTTAYLKGKYESTWHRQLELQRTSASEPGSRPNLELDLTRVYGGAALCVKFNSYSEFRAALNQITVRQIAGALVGDPLWLPQELHRAKLLILPPTDTVERTA